MAWILLAAVLASASFPAFLGASDPDRRGQAATPNQADDQSPTLRRFDRSQVRMGTLFRVLLYAGDEAAATRASDAAFERIAALESVYSDYNDQSELSRLSRHAGGPALLVSDELFSLLSRSLDLSRRSAGAFDVTVGPVVRLWRKARRDRELPSSSRLAEALTRVGFEKVLLDPQQRTVQLTVAGMRLDLGGIAKGAACDAALAVLFRHGFHHALVEGGGDMAIGAPPPNRPGWEVAIESPGQQPRLSSPGQQPRLSSPPQQQGLLSRGLAGPHAQTDSIPVLALCRCGVATSGDAYQFVELGGVRYSHIVDPKTGLGTTHQRQVTVIAPEGTLADALATAVAVLPVERGLALIDQTPGCAALIVERGECPRITRSTRWPKDQSP